MVRVLNYFGKRRFPFAKTAIAILGAFGIGIAIRSLIPRVEAIYERHQFAKAARECVLHTPPPSAVALDVSLQPIGSKNGSSGYATLHKYTYEPGCWVKLSRFYAPWLSNLPVFSHRGAGVVFLHQWDAEGTKCFVAITTSVSDRADKVLLNSACVVLNNKGELDFPPSEAIGDSGSLDLQAGIDRVTVGEAVQDSGDPSELHFIVRSNNLESTITAKIRVTVSLENGIMPPEIAFYDSDGNQLPD